MHRDEEEEHLNLFLSVICNLWLLQDSKYAEAENISVRLGVQIYAVRFLKYDRGTSNHSELLSGPTTPDRIYDEGMRETCLDDELSEVWIFIFSFSSWIMLSIVLTCFWLLIIFLSACT